MNLNQPKPFAPNKNQLAQDWQVWRDEFLVFLKLSNAYTQFSEEQRALLLINNMGTEAIKAMKQISFENPDDQKDMDILLLKFDEFFNPTLNEVEQRCKFFSRRKHPDEDLDKYLLDMKERAAKCNFGNQSEKFILDMLILSMDKHLRDLIWASKLETLPDIVYNYKQYNINQEKMKEISDTMRENLNAENAKSAKLNNSEPLGKQPQTRRICSKCGTNHAYRDCPAFDTICQMCSGKGHFTSKCTFFEKAYKASNASQVKNEGSEAATSKAKQNQEHAQKDDTLLQCLWCNSYHMPGRKCPHEAKVIQNTDQAMAHQPNARPTVQTSWEPAEFVKITTTRCNPQHQRQAQNHTRQENANQRNQNTRYSTNHKKKNDKSDSCCIS